VPLTVYSLPPDSAEHGVLVAIWFQGEKSLVILAMCTAEHTVGC
jgi:hypothetical protein